MSSDNSNLVFVDAQDLINLAENPADLSLSTNVVMAGLWYDLREIIDGLSNGSTYYYLMWTFEFDDGAITLSDIKVYDDSKNLLTISDEESDELILALSDDMSFNAKLYAFDMNGWTRKAIQIMDRQMLLFKQ